MDCTHGHCFLHCGSLKQPTASAQAECANWTRNFSCQWQGRIHRRPDRPARITGERSDRVAVFTVIRLPDEVVTLLNGSA
jgi:hypothetical protein